MMIGYGGYGWFKKVCSDNVNTILIDFLIRLLCGRRGGENTLCRSISQI